MVPRVLDLLHLFSPWPCTGRWDARCQVSLRGLSHWDLGTGEMRGWMVGVWVSGSVSTYDGGVISRLLSGILSLVPRFGLPITSSIPDFRAGTSLIPVLGYLCSQGWSTSAPSTWLGPGCPSHGAGLQWGPSSPFHLQGCSAILTSC